LDERKIKRICKEVLSYFVRNPQAADTLEGIARWRLLDELARRKVDETAAAVKWLVAHGYLLEISSSASAAIYRVNEPKLAEAKLFVGLQRDSPRLRK
jgi:hypothetical protein